MHSRTSDITIKGFVGPDRMKNHICLFGKLEWHMSYHPIIKEEYNRVDHDVNKHAWVTVIFNGLPCADLLCIKDIIARANYPLVYQNNHNAIKIPGFRIRVNSDVDADLFYQAIRQIFAIAFAEIPKDCINNQEITIDDNFKEPKDPATVDDEKE